MNTHALFCTLVLLVACTTKHKPEASLVVTQASPDSVWVTSPPAPKVKKVQFQKVDSLRAFKDSLQVLYERIALLEKDEGVTDSLTELRWAERFVVVLDVPFDSSITKKILCRKEGTKGAYFIRYTLSEQQYNRTSEVHTTLLLFREQEKRVRYTMMNVEGISFAGNAIDDYPHKDIIRQIFVALN